MTQSVSTKSTQCCRLLALKFKLKLNTGKTSGCKLQLGQTAPSPFLSHFSFQMSTAQRLNFPSFSSFLGKVDFQEVLCSCDLSKTYLRLFTQQLELQTTDLPLSR